MLRAAIMDFSLANQLYATASVSFYTVNPATGAKTAVLANLYQSPTGTAALPNPQVLDSQGKFKQPVYIGEAVIGVVAGLTVGDHDTGIIAARGQWKGDWATDTLYLDGDEVRDAAAGIGTANIYVCAVQHTSDTWATDLAAGKWSLRINVVDVETAKAAAEAAAAIAVQAALDADADRIAAESANDTAQTAAASATADAAIAATKATEASDSADAALAAAGNNIRGIAPERTPATWMLGALAFLDSISSALVSGLGLLAVKDTIATADIDANAVTLTELEHGTQGDVLYYGAAGAPARLGAGTSGQALTSGGAEANPAWAWGSHVQRATATFGTRTTVAGASYQIPGDDTIPQNTEGYEVLTCAITPKAASHKLRITAMVPFQMAAATTTIVLALFRDDGTDAIATTWHEGNSNTNFTHEIWCEVDAGSTSATTFKLRMGPTSNVDTYICGNSASRLFGGVMLVRMFIDEYKD